MNLASEFVSTVMGALPGFLELIAKIIINTGIQLQALYEQLNEKVTGKVKEPALKHKSVQQIRQCIGEN